MERHFDTCQIYVAPLAAYSAGHDTGEWITVEKDESALQASIISPFFKFNRFCISHYR